MVFLDTESLPVREPLPGWKGRFFSSQSMTFAYYEIEAGSSIHEHSHPNEEVWHVISGELEITVAGEQAIARAGSVALVAPDTLHAVRAITATKAMVVDHPLRAAIGGVTVDA